MKITAIDKNYIALKQLAPRKDVTLANNSNLGNRKSELIVKNTPISFMGDSFVKTNSKNISFLADMDAPTEYGNKKTSVSFRGIYPQFLIDQEVIGEYEAYVEKTPILHAQNPSFQQKAEDKSSNLISQLFNKIKSIFVA